jgi:hypothetical protein
MTAGLHSELAAAGPVHWSGRGWANVLPQYRVGHETVCWEVT